MALANGEMVGQNNGGPMCRWEGNITILYEEIVRVRNLISNVNDRDH